MMTDLQSVTRQAMALSSKDRASLAQQLWESVTPHPQDASDIDFDELARRRNREMDENPVSVLTHQEVMDAALRRFA